MEGTWGSTGSATRRNVLKGIGATTAAALAGGAVPASGAAETSDDAVTLGDFESGLAGWRGVGETTLDRVAKSERPAAVTSGDHALAATTDRTAGRIENEERVRNADLVANPSLFATVTPGRIPGSDVAISVRFRLHYVDDGLFGDDTGVVESDAQTVRPHAPAVVSWDLRELAETTRADATKLEIDWSPATDSASDSLDSDAGEAWTVVVDDVHLTDDGDRIRRLRLGEHFERLQFALGAYRSTEVHLRTEHLESGEFVFASGSSVPYTVETLTDDGVEFVLDGVEYLFGGEWL
ncbi:Tat (twin-arginine translocation) pathway signal sequence [Halomicrobium zhouii]|uniref:Tat (Twin-arginine translocation) pathway signal sequence n=1 Tax=Halomicrobium zhouii TaxID=767519 RepID=A0A1I6LFX8_9EURY|nr:Tat (twin-arginine translocation) pathway signal sequence [Halomicrobium zhouii]